MWTREGLFAWYLGGFVLVLSILLMCYDFAMEYVRRKYPEKTDHPDRPDLDNHLKRGNR